MEEGPREAGPEVLAAPDTTSDAALLERALFEVKKVIVGQDHMVERMLVVLLARGHCLLEGVPGVAKTLAVQTLADVVGGSFVRIQFTNDLVPSDIVGTRVYRASRETFDIALGPIFANFVLADEINRAPAKVQSALLRSCRKSRSRSAVSPTGCRCRSWYSPRRTRSSPKASTRCRRRSATGS